MPWLGGPPLGADGRLHTTFTRDASTLRFTSKRPNLQNWPHADDPDAPWASRAKSMITADTADDVLLEIDFSAIEGVLVGYFARSPFVVRLAKLGLHDFVTARLNGVNVDPAWSDGDLLGIFKEAKKRWPTQRTMSKRGTYSSFYGATPPTLQRVAPSCWPSIKEAAVWQQRIFELLPDVKRWQHETVDQAHEQGYLRNPFGYLHRFWRAKKWTKVSGRWESEWGEDAKAALAFRPQSTAAGIITEAMLALVPLLREHGFERALRLQIHDSLLFNVARKRALELVALASEVMERPVMALPLPPAWGMGSHLSIGTEAKAGYRWSQMGNVKEAVLAEAA